MENIFDQSVILGIVGVLVALTNIITQVLKRVTWDKLPTNILAVIVSMALTMAASVAYCQIEAVPITWYSVVAFVVVGFMVAYAAMFGFDKLKEAISQFGAETTASATAILSQTKAEQDEPGGEKEDGENE